MIRPASPADTPAVLALWARARNPYAVSRDDPEAVAALLARDPGCLLLAEHDGALVGTLIAAWDGWRGNMYRLAVPPELRRGGIALALARAGETRLRELGARRITALVPRGDTAAEGLWAAAGYEHDTGINRWVRATELSRPY